MGRGEEYRNVNRREISTLSRSFFGKPVPDSYGFQEIVDRKVHPVFLGAKSFQGRSGYLGPVISRVPCGKRERVSRCFGIVILHK